MPDDLKTTEWVDVLKDFVFHIADDVLRESLEAAIARMQAREHTTTHQPSPPHAKC